MLRINETNRLTRQELEDYRVNSGITALQYAIISANTMIRASTP